MFWRVAESVREAMAQNRQRTYKNKGKDLSVSGWMGEGGSGEGVSDGVCVCVCVRCGDGEVDCGCNNPFITCSK